MYFSRPRAKNYIKIAKCIEPNEFSFSMLAFYSSYNSASGRATGIPSNSPFCFHHGNKVFVSSNLMTVITAYNALSHSVYLLESKGKKTSYATGPSEILKVLVIW